MLHCLSENPFRVADWRWQRAKGALSRSQPLPTRRRDTGPGHKWIREAMQFQQRLAACATELQRSQLAESMPAVFWAHYAWNAATPAAPVVSGAGGPAAMRWSIEARILARCNDFEIGFACGVAPAVVDAYENLFFNVRDKLRHQEYILHCVLGESIQRGLTAREYDLLWKLYGYFYGPYMLNALTSKFVNPTWCATPDNVSSAVQDDAISTMKLKAAIAAKTVVVDGRTQMDLLHTFTEFVEVERNTDSAGKAKDQIMDHIQAMMSGLPFNIGGRDPQHKHISMDTGPIALYDNGAVELTYEETLKVSVGQSLPHARTIEALAFPVQTDG